MSTITMRHARWLAIAAVTGVALAGCSTTSGQGKASSGETAHLTMMITQSADSELRKTMQSIIDDFQTANEGITITLLPASNQYETDVRVRMGANDLPDIFSTHGWSVKRYAEFLEPLTDEPWAKDVNPVLDSAMRDKNGVLYAFPTEVDEAGIMYNATVLKKAGVDPTAIKTWEDFGAAAEKVKATGVSPIVAGAKDVYYPGNIANLMAPGIYTDAQKKQLLDGTFPQEPWASISDLIVSWQKAGYFNPDYVSASDDDMSKAIAQDQAGFAFGQNATLANALTYNPDVKVGYFPIPNDSGEQYLMGGEGVNALGIAKKGHVDAARKFIAFLAQPENASKAVAGTGNPSGLLTVHADLGPLQASFDSAIANKIPLEPYFDRVYMPNGMWGAMCTAVDSLISGQGDTQSSVTDVEAEFKSLFGASK